jgi:hypothetical protein
MKTNKLTFVSMLSALFITASAFAPVYAVGDKPPTKIPKPTTTASCNQSCQTYWSDNGWTCNKPSGKINGGICECRCDDVGGARKKKL